MLGAVTDESIIPFAEAVDLGYQIPFYGKLHNIHPHTRFAPNYPSLTLIILILFTHILMLNLYGARVDSRASVCEPQPT